MIITDPMQGKHEVRYMAYIHPIFPPSQNDWGNYQGFAIMGANIPIECSSISHVITGHLPFTIHDIKLMLPGPAATLRSLSEDVRVDKLMINY